MPQETLRSTIIPGLRYRDARAAIVEWLCRVLGLERRLAAPHGEDEIAHAQLALGGGMVMLGSMRDDERGCCPIHFDGIKSIILREARFSHDRLHTGTQ